MDIGVVGLGRMGAGVAERLLSGGHRVVAFNRSQDKVDAFAQKGAVPSSSLAQLVSLLSRPRAIWLYLPAGGVTEAHLVELETLLEDGDVVIDGGNSNFQHTINRALRLAEKGIQFLDIGTSGGIAGRTEGYCLMAGGNKQVFDSLQPLWESVAQSNGYAYMGPSGSGHYVKMVHNAVEYGMMQAYGEGIQLLDTGSYAGKLNLIEITALWQNGSIVRSYLGELLHSALVQDPTLQNVQGVVADSGEGKWTLQEALECGVPVPVLAAALFARYSSRLTTPLSAKVVAVLRTGFGGHVTNPDLSVPIL